MKKYIIFTSIIIGSLLLWGCSASEDTITTTIGNPTAQEIITTTIGNPTAQEILKTDAEADIFQWDSIIYKTNIDWVDDLVLTESDFVGEIQFNSTKSSEFNDATANVLPIGAKIYKAKERNDVFIAKYEDELKYYYGLVEG